MGSAITTIITLQTDQKKFCHRLNSIARTLIFQKLMVSPFALFYWIKHIFSRNLLSLNSTSLTIDIYYRLLLGAQRVETFEQHSVFWLHSMQFNLDFFIKKFYVSSD